jgi:transposase
VAELQGRTEKLERRFSRNSQNSNQPSSADAPFDRAERKKKKSRKKRGGQKGHPGHRHKLLKPTKVLCLKPLECSYGCNKFKWVHTFYRHQQIELPQIELDVTHYVLYKGCCSK